MNPDLEDPNNHVPAITPDDAWDDVGELAETQQPGLPPKRLDRGLPPKKAPSAPRVKHHSPALKLEREGQSDTAEPFDVISGAKGEDEVEEGLEPVALPPSKESRRVKWEHTKNGGDVAPTPPGDTNEPEVPMEVRTAIPDVPRVKRLRVNEIGATADAPAARPGKMSVAKINVDAAEGGSPGAPQKKRRFSHGERSEWGGNDSPASLKWMLYTGLGIFVLVILAVALSQLLKKGGGDLEHPVYRPLVEGDEELGGGGEDLKRLELFTDSIEKAKVMFATYACAKDTGDFIALVHAPDRNREVIEGNWKPLAMKPGWMPGGDSLWSVIDREGIRYAIFECTLPDFTNFKALFRQAGDGMTLDWKATVGYGTADFAAMKKGSGDGSEVRAAVSQADFYTHSFPEGKFRCYRIMSPDGELNLWGYALAGSKTDEELMKLFLPSPVTGESQSEIQLTLSMEPGGGESLPDQWTISGIKRLDWLDE